MIISSILRIIILLSFSIILAPNPITAALCLLAISILIATVFATSTSTWLAIIVFLVYVAGVLVIFAYFVAITPNQQIILSTNPFILLTILLITFTYSITKIFNFTTVDKSIKIIFFYTDLNPVTLLFLAVILLLTIVIVVKVSSQSKGPLRSFISYV
jgi:NADH:ubiquinone oxidoreductase subunit 6 (subunit J)